MNMIDHNPGNNPHLRSSNIRQLTSCIAQYYQEHLMHDFTFLEKIDALEVASAVKLDALQTIAEFVLGSVVTCEDKEIYITPIMGLSQDILAELIPIVQKFVNGEIEEDHGNSVGVEEVDPETKHLREQLQHFITEREQLEKELGQQRKKCREYEDHNVRLCSSL